MTATATLSEHIARAAALIGFVAKHRAELLELSGDVPKAINLVSDFHDTFKAADVQASVAAAEATAPDAPPAARKLTAAQAAAHVEQHGLSDLDRAILRRESVQTG